MKKPLTYISLFSSAGVGCYGFKLNGFECIATNELLTKRLKIQAYNNKCKYETGYIGGDISNPNVKAKLLTELKFWQDKHKIKEPDVLISTPPCQGMSVANHKKNDEKSRNSLVIESIKVTQELLPKFFIYENVRAFLNTICTDIDGIDKPIKEAIKYNLGGQYNILSKIVNFKEYGSNSSRTRTLVIGIRKDIQDVSPFDIFPKKQKAKSLRQLIGDLPALEEMGEISEDIFHGYREFDQRMLPWIENLEEGQSAFEQTEELRIPHRVIDGKLVPNKSKNGDKYARWYWDKEGPCVHTRNDILSSQNTVHPKDNRVFSIRELMRMMSIPESFEWSNVKTKDLNERTHLEKKLFLKKEELNINNNLGVTQKGRAFRTRFFAPIVTKRAQTIASIPNAKLKLAS
jgi:DNA (cytosine-5)-methyltransferase 1